MREYEQGLDKILTAAWSRTPGCDAARVVTVFLRRFGGVYAGRVLTEVRKELRRK